MMDHVERVGGGQSQDVTCVQTHCIPYSDSWFRCDPLRSRPTRIKRYCSHIWTRCIGNSEWKLETGVADEMQGPTFRLDICLHPGRSC